MERGMVMSDHIQPAMQSAAAFDEGVAAYINLTMHRIDTQAELKLFYDESRGIFISEENDIVGNPFELITPSDLRLYQSDHGYNVFPHRHDPKLYCTILEYPEEPEENWEDGIDEWEVDCIGLPFVCSGGRCRYATWEESERIAICEACGARRGA